MNRRLITFCAILLLGARVAMATTHVVNSQATFDAALSVAATDDIIEWEDGTYADIFMDIDKNNLTIRAESSGGVTFNGASRVKITSDYITLDGFQFVGGDIGTEHVIRTNGSYNLLTNLNISQYTCYKYLNIDGDSQYNVVSYCNFENRLNYEDQNIVSVRSHATIPNYHVIKYCSFQNFSGNPADGPGGDDGVEPIRIGVSTEASHISNTTVEYCYFEQCNGDDEIISNKSTQNLIRYNTFNNNPYGELVLRHGSEAVVYGNFFLNGKGGIRVREGQDHVIFNNYFENLDDRALFLQNEASDPLSDISILYNTFVDTEDFRLGGDGDPNPPANITIANNIFLNPKDDLFRNPTGTETWMGNIYSGSLGMTEPASGLTSDDPELSNTTTGYYQPLASSPAIDMGVSGYPALLQFGGLDTDHLIEKDVQGLTRPLLDASKDIGCSEYTASLEVKPLATLDNTGPAYLRSSNTSSDLYISEVLFAPGGNDDPQEFIEIRGGVGETIPANTYLIFIEGDAGSSVGKIKAYFDLGGLVLGSNGYLALVMDNSGYSFVAGATIREADVSGGGDGWIGEPLYTGSGSESTSSGWRTIEDASENILLVTTSTAFVNRFDDTAGFKEVESYDIDTNDDGEIDNISGWTIHDGVSVLDNDDALEYGYAPLIFTQNGVENTIHPSTSLLVEIDFKGGYVGRIGESTGSTGDDWVCATTSDNGLGQFTIDSESSDQSFANVTLSQVGGPSLVPGEVVYDGSTSLAVMLSDNLTISSSLSSSVDISCHDLKVAESQVLTIESPATLTVYGSLTNEGSIVIESGASLITYSGKSAEMVNVERNTRYGDAEGKYSFVGTPVVQNSNVTNTTLGAYVYRYDETKSYGSNDGLNRWLPMTGELLPATGYTQAFQKEIIFIGVPNDGTITHTGTYTEDTDDANEGWNLVSNPYPAAIHVSSFLTTNTNIEGAVYIWDDNGSETSRGSNADYIVANGTVTTNNTPAGGETRYNQHLGSAQGFFVKLNDNTDTDILFTEAMRVSGSNGDAHFFRQSTPSYVRINLTNKAGLFKQAVVGWLADISDVELDRSFDARVFHTTASDALYTLKTDKALAIQGVREREEIPLGIHVSETGHYTLSLELDKYSGQDLYLRDKETGEEINLATNSYSFYVDAGQHKDRFLLVSKRSEVLSIELTNKDWQVYTHGKYLYLKKISETMQSGTFKLYTLTGKEVQTFITSQSISFDLSDVPKGIYLISDGEETSKVLLKD